MKLKVTLMMLFATVFSLGAYAQACCTGASISYPNGATTIAYTPSVETTYVGSTTITGVGDPNVVSMGTTTYSAPSVVTDTYQGAYTSSGPFYASRSCCQGGTGVGYPTGNTATVTTYGPTTNIGIGAGDPNVIYMTGVTTSIAPSTVITSDVGNSCCGGPGITYPGSTVSSSY